MVAPISRIGAEYRSQPFSCRREKGWVGPVLPAAPASARMAGPPAPFAALPGSDGRPRPGQRPACLPTHGPPMNFHEYQAKKLFADSRIAVPAGRVARTPEEAVGPPKAIGGASRAVKEPQHAGGRREAGAR